jgi:hypothetical protein
MQNALVFYRDTPGLAVFEQSDRSLGFKCEAIRLFVEPGDLAGPVLECMVDDVPRQRRSVLPRAAWWWTNSRVCRAVTFAIRFGRYSSCSAC